ncbi:MAG: hypothetical protein MJ229_00305 [bacterium]|nr:hypothetical protein [bacterium]
MKKIIAILAVSMILLAPSAAMAGTHGVNGKITPKSIGAGALSLIVWPGIGQLMNYEKNTDKVLTHALLGFTGVFRFWSCYDGVVNRKGGVWDNRI